MYNKILSLMLGVYMVFGLTTVMAAQAEQAPAILPDGAPSITRLPNGLTVMIVEDKRFPLVSTRLYVHAGSAYEQKDEAGISHVLEHMVFKGTEKRPKGIVASEVESAGGYLNAGTSFDYTVYLTDMPSRHWKLGMDVVRDMAFHPMLDKSELESEKEVVIAELQRGKDSPGSQIFENLQAATLANTPYDRPIIGFTDTIRALTVEKMQAYINKYYQPQSMLLVVVGNVNKDEVLTEASKQFAPYKNSQDVVQPQAIEIANLKAGKASGKVFVSPGPWNKVYLAAALPIPDMADVRTIPLDVLSHLLGGDQTSLFWKRYKYDQQLVDNISVSSMNFERIGIFYISAELSPDKVQAFWQALTTDMAKLKASDFSQEDIARAKLNIEDDLFRAKETLAGLASKVGHLQFFLGNGEQAEQNIINSLRAVDSNQLQIAIESWLKPERMSTVILTPEGDKLSAAELDQQLNKNWPSKTAAVAEKTSAPNVDSQIVDLGQGRKLILIPDATLPYISADMTFSGGDALLQDKQQGLSALMARTLTRGTDKRNALAMQTWLAERAAGLSASSSRQTFTVSLTSPSRFGKDMFEMLAEVLHNPAFGKDEIEREKASQIAAIKSREDQPLGLVFRRLPEFLFPDSVYGYVPQGQIDNVKTYTEKDITALWQKQNKQPWVLAIAGQFDADEVISMAKKLLQGQASTVKVPVPTWAKKQELNLTLPGRNQAHYLLVFKTVPYDHPDAPALDLLQNILAGQSGLLFKDLRDNKGLGYTVTAFNRLMTETGYMAFYIGTEPSKLNEAETGFKDILSSLHKQLLPETELARGKNQMEGDYHRERQSLGSRAAEASSLIQLGKPLSFNLEQINTALKLTPENLQQTAKKYLEFKNAYVIKLVP